MSRRLKLLLIGDDEEDFVSTDGLLRRIEPFEFDLDWAKNYAQGIEAICRADYDAVLLDYRLGGRNGLELLREAVANGCSAPIIFLTTREDSGFENEVMETGAADYLIKTKISPDLLRRSIRYCISGKLTELELKNCRDHLEELVKERTEQLESVNHDLRMEISEREAAAEALRDSQNCLHLALESGRAGTWYQETGCGRSVWDDFTHKLFGLEPGAFSGKTEHFLCMVHPDDRDRLRAELEALKGSAGFSTAYRVVWPDTSVHFISARGKVQYDSSGRAARIMGINWDFTELYEAQETLRQSEERLRLTLQATKDGIWDWNILTGSVILSPSCYTMLGYEPYEFPQNYQTIRRLIHADDVVPAEREAIECAARGGDLAIEIRMRTKSGGWCWVLARGAVIDRDASGNPARMVGTNTDITEFKLTLEKLQDGEALFRNLFESHAAVKLIIDPDTGNIIDANKAAESFYRRPRERLRKMNMQEINTLSPEEVKSEIDKARTRKRIHFEFQHRLGDGSIRDVEVYSSSIMVKGKELLHSIIHDITGRVQRERQIELLNRLYCLLSHVSQEVVRAVTPDRFLREVCRIIVEEGGFKVCWIGCLNPATNAVLPMAAYGEGREYVDGITVCADNLPEGCGPTGTCIRERHPVVYNDFLHDAGTLPWQERAARFGIAASGAFPIESDGRIWGALTIYSGQIDSFGEDDVILLQKVAGDIGFALANLERERVRREAEERLRASEDRYRRLFEDSVLGVFRSTIDGKILEANSAWVRMYGFDSPEQAKSRINDIAVDLYADPSNRNTIVRMILEATGPVHAEILFKRKDGNTFPANFHAWAVRGEDGKRSYLEGFVEDISERKRAEAEKERLEAQLRQAQKLEAIGTLAGGIAHDFNNILAPIIGYTEMALSDLPQLDPMRFGQEQTLIAAYRARDLVKQLLSFSRPGKEQQKIPVELGSVVKEALKLLKASLPSSIEIRYHIEKGTANADPTQIHQVLMNLCTNAAHAMDEKGILDVRLSRVSLNDGDLTGQPAVYIKPGAYLKLSVADTGFGMDKHTVDRIFDPYFTTKEVGKGTGLGLAVVHGIVKRHKGAVTVQSEPGKGTTFNVYIPASEEDAEVDIETGQVLPTGSENILFIDDEQALVEMGTAILNRLGYKVVSESNGMKALRLFRSDPKNFDLVITDYTMPKLTGLELARKVHAIRPHTPILLCTGSCDRITKKSLKGLKIGVLAKPYGMNQLSQSVRKLFDGKIIKR